MLQSKASPKLRCFGMGFGRKWHETPAADEVCFKENCKREAKPTEKLMSAVRVILKGAIPYFEIGAVPKWEGMLQSDLSCRSIVRLALRPFSDRLASLRWWRRFNCSGFLLLCRSLQEHAEQGRFFLPLHKTSFPRVLISKTAQKLMSKRLQTMPKRRLRRSRQMPFQK